MLVHHLAKLENYPEYEELRHPLDVLTHQQDAWPTGAGIILSANCSDEAVNRALPRFLARYPTPQSMNGATVESVVPLLPAISHRGHKAEYLTHWANYLIERNGQVDNSITVLTRVRGIGRKSAALILHQLKGNDEGFPLDTHALRVLDRLAWFPPTRNAKVRERQLLQEVPLGSRYRVFLKLTLHGRLICDAARPQCQSCRLQQECAFGKNQLSCAAGLKIEYASGG